MCPAPGQINVILCVRRAATSQPVRIAANLFVRRPKKIGGSDCVLYFICPASVYVTVLKSYRKSICPAGDLKICRSDCVRRAENTLKCLFAKILDWFHANRLWTYWTHLSSA